MNENFGRIDGALQDLIRAMLVPNTERIKLTEVVKILTDETVV
jgi:hypothetical protein